MKRLKRTLALFLMLLVLLPAAAFAAAGEIILPELVSLEVSGLDRVNNDLQYEVSVRLEDNGSTIHHITVLFENNDNGRDASLVLYPQNLRENFTYAGVLKINAYVPEGTYVLKQVVLQDEEGNYHVYMRARDLDGSGTGVADNGRFAIAKDRLPRAVTLYAETGVKQADETAPKLQSFKLSADSVAAKSPLALTVEAGDGNGSGIDTVSVRFVNEAGRGVSATLKQSTDDLYTGSITAGQTMHPGAYTLESIAIRDKAGNRAVYRPGDMGLPAQVTYSVTAAE